MAKKVKLPDVVYVYYDYDGEDSFLMACDSLEDTAEKGNKVLVGIYRLESTVNVTLEVKSQLASK